VVIRGFEKVADDESELLFEYLKRPAPGTTVVFQAPTVDQRRKVTTALLKTCTVVTLDHPSEADLDVWIKREFSERGCTIEHSALTYLVTLIGPDLLRLSNEIAKLAAFAGGGQINESMVQQLVPRVREHTPWELWDAIILRDRPRALRLTRRLLDDRAEPVMLVGALAGLYRRMLLAKELLGRGAAADQVNRATGRFGRNAAEFNGRVLRTSREEIVHGLRRIARVDRAIKSSEATPRLQMELLVCELMLPESFTWKISE
jgi:DNA polymerase-3 subunit delta